MNPEVIQAKQILKRIIVVSILIGVIFVAFNVLKNGRLVLKFNNRDITKAIVIVNSNSNEELINTSTNEEDFSKNLPPGEYEIRVFGADNTAVTYFVNIERLLKTTSVDVNINNQRNRDKLSREAESCPIYSGDVLYSYNCFGNGSLYLHTFLTEKDYPRKVELKKVGEGVIKAEPYKKGILVLSRQDLGEATFIYLQYVKNNGQIKRYRVDNKYLSEDFRVNLEVDSATNSSFVVTGGKNNSVLFYEKIASDPSVVGFDISKSDLESPVEHTIDLRNGMLMTAYVPQIPESEENIKEGVLVVDTVPSELYLHDLSTGNTKVIRTKLALGEVKLCNENYLCNLVNNVLSVYSMGEDGINELLSISSADGLLVDSNETVFYIQNNKIYGLNLNDKYSELIFSTSNLNVSGFGLSDKGVIFNAFSATDTSEASRGTNTYLIKRAYSDSNFFVDNYLPYKNLSFGFVRDSDYHKKLIVVDVWLDSWESTRLNRPPDKYDVKEFNRKKKIIINDLASKGINSKDYTIVVNP